MSNLKFLFESFDRVAGLTTKSSPTLGELHHLHKSVAVQSVIQKLNMTAAGCKCCTNQIKWETLAQELQKAKWNVHACKANGSKFGKKRGTEKEVKSCKKRQTSKVPATEDDSDDGNFLGTKAGGYCMSHPKQSHKVRESRIKKRKETHHVKSAASRSIHLPGPMPAAEDKGYLTLTPSVAQIDTQGNMF